MKRAFLFILAVALVGGCGSPGAETQSTPVDQTGKRNYLDEGMQYLKEANATAAIKSFDEAIKQNPLDPEPYLILGQTYMRLQDYTRAIDSFAAASRVAPNEGEIYYLLAVNHRMAGNMNDAKLAAQKSVEMFRRAQDETNFEKSVALLQGLVREGEQTETE